MKIIFRKVLTTLLCVMLCVGALAPQAMAATLFQAEIPITVYMQGTGIPATDVVSAEIKAVTPDAPMPENSKIDITCEGDEAKGTGVFTINYDALGIYQYQVIIHGGNYSLAEYGKDLTYNVTVSVINDNGEYGAVKVAAYLDGSKEKSEITDTNQYFSAVELKVIKNWDTIGQTHPDSVEVTLYNGSTAVEVVSLGAWNNWTHAWHNLDRDGSWSVMETNVPDGYVPSYTYEKNMVIITNTESLIQTGQLSWPIPVMGALGLMFIGYGVFVITKKRNNDRV